MSKKRSRKLPRRINTLKCVVIDNFLDLQGAKNNVWHKLFDFFHVLCVALVCFHQRATVSKKSVCFKAATLTITVGSDCSKADFTII